MSLNSSSKYSLNDPTFAKYAVILAGIVFSWAEVCLLDFKVLPTENFSGAFLRSGNGGAGNEGSRYGSVDEGVGVVNHARIIGGSSFESGRRPRGAPDSESISSLTSSLALGEDNFHTPVDSEEEDVDGEKDAPADSISSSTDRFGDSSTSSSSDLNAASAPKDHRCVAVRNESNKRGKTSILRGSKKHESKMNNDDSFGFTNSEKSGSKRSLYHRYLPLIPHFLAAASTQGNFSSFPFSNLSPPR